MNAQQRREQSRTTRRKEKEQPRSKDPEPDLPATGNISPRLKLGGGGFFTVGQSAKFITSAR